MNNVGSFINVGCGDWRSSRYIHFRSANYIGYDIAKDVIGRNRSAFGQHNIELNLMPDNPADLPYADLCIIKDVFQHMSESQILFYRDAVLSRYKRRLITNSFRAISYAQNIDVNLGGFRGLDLKQDRYKLPGSLC